MLYRKWLAPKDNDGEEICGTMEGRVHHAYQTLSDQLTV